MATNGTAGHGKAWNGHAPGRTAGRASGASEQERERSERDAIVFYFS